MPGYKNDYYSDISDMINHNIKCIICLTHPNEIEKKSPIYATNLKIETVPFTALHFHINDFSAPDKLDGYLEVVKTVADKLKNGENVLIHCDEGIGRTGLFVASILTVLGINMNLALKLIHDAGSRIGTSTQKSVVSWISKQTI